MEKTSRLQRRIHKKETRKEDVAVQRAQLAKRQRSKRVINYALVIVVLAIVCYGLYSWLAPQSGQYDKLAKCITAKGGIMYGTNWCPHCQEQKRLFGNSFRYITFIDCDANGVACSAAKVESFPTWQFARGVTMTGTQTLADLAQRTDCPLE